VSVEVKEQAYAGTHHPKTEDLPHGQPKEDKAELCVRLSNEFDQKPQYSVTYQESGENLSVTLGSQPEPPQEQKQHWSFKNRFVQLGRVPWQASALGEHYPPRQGRDPPKDLAVNEIAEPAQHQSDGSGEGSDDPLMDKALEIVLAAGKASASYLQRRLKVGYNRAARLVEEMERMGIVGPAQGSKPRDILHVPER